MSLSSVKVIKVMSEEDVKLYHMSQRDFNQIKLLMKEGEVIGEYPEEINNILKKYTPIEIDGVISTEGDGWGWWDNI